MELFEVSISRVFASWVESARRDGMAAPRVAALAAIIVAVTDPLGVSDEEVDVAIEALLQYREAEASRLSGGA